LVGVNVAVDNSAPTVSISSPSPDASVAGATPVVAAAGDSQGLASVAFFVDGTTSIGTDSNGTDGWSVTWATASVANGPHSLTARATNLAGLATTSDPVPVTVNNTAAPQTLNIAVASGADDIEERLSDGRIDTASNDLDMLLDNTVAQSAVGLRFLGVTIPAGATITNAYIQFRADETWADPTNLTVNGVASDNASAWSTAKFSLSRAPRTAGSVAWTPPAWTERQQGLDQRTSDLAAIVQELVNRPGWAAGNAVAYVITGSGRRVAKAFEAGGTSVPVLHIEFVV
jgi:Big-like domain-containing protein